MRSPVDRESVEAFLSSHEPIDEPHLLADGQIVGEWSIRTFLGRGGNGEVYRATHTLLGIEAAIKVLTRNDELTRTRFKREAQIISTKAHPAFPHFFAFGELDGTPYLVIELLESYPLPGSDKDVAKYLTRVCEGVACLHGLGLVHRDIKPQNVLRRKGSDQPVLIDLGLAKDITLPPAHEGVSLSIVNGRAVGVGTPKYAAPEQFAGGEISPAADIHALGMLANECFQGKPPRCWGRIIRRSTSSIPNQRYATIVDFVKAIKRRHLLQLVLAIVVPVISVVFTIGVLTMIGYRQKGGENIETSKVVPIKESLSVSEIQVLTNSKPQIVREDVRPVVTNDVKTNPVLRVVAPIEKANQESGKAIENAVKTEKDKSFYQRGLDGSNE